MQVNNGHTHGYGEPCDGDCPKYAPLFPRAGRGEALTMTQSNDCTHQSATGVDQTEVGPGKVWRCDHCGLTYRDAGDGRFAVLAAAQPSQAPPVWAGAALPLTEDERRHGQMLDGVLLFHEVAVGRILADRRAAEGDLRADRYRLAWKSACRRADEFHEASDEREAAAQDAEDREGDLRARIEALADEWGRLAGDSGWLASSRQLWRGHAADLRAALAQPTTDGGDTDG